MAKVRLNIEISEDLAGFLDELASREDVTRTEIVRRALAVLKAYKEQMDVGRTHLGFTEDMTQLDAELIGILTPPPMARQKKPPEEGEKPVKAA